MSRRIIIAIAALLCSSAGIFASAQEGQADKKDNEGVYTAPVTRGEEKSISTTEPGRSDADAWKQSEMGRSGTTSQHEAAEEAEEKENLRDAPVGQTQNPAARPGTPGTRTPGTEVEGGTVPREDEPVRERGGSAWAVVGVIALALLAFFIYRMAKGGGPGDTTPRQGRM